MLSGKTIVLSGPASATGAWFIASTWMLIVRELVYSESDADASMTKVPAVWKIKVVCKAVASEKLALALGGSIILQFVKRLLLGTPSSITVANSSTLLPTSVWTLELLIAISRTREDVIS